MEIDKYMVTDLKNKINVTGSVINTSLLERQLGSNKESSPNKILQSSIKKGSQYLLNSDLNITIQKGDREVTGGGVSPFFIRGYESGLQGMQVKSFDKVSSPNLKRKTHIKFNIPSNESKMLRSKLEDDKRCGSAYEHLPQESEEPYNYDSKVDLGYRYNNS